MPIPPPPIPPYTPFPDVSYENIPTIKKKAQARWKNLPKSTQNKIVEELSKGLFKGQEGKTSRASVSDVIKSNLKRVLLATGKKALPFGAALTLWELAGRPDIPGLEGAKKAVDQSMRLSQKAFQPVFDASEAAVGQLVHRARTRERDTEEDKLRQLVGSAW